MVLWFALLATSTAGKYRVRTKANGDVVHVSKCNNPQFQTWDVHPQGTKFIKLRSNGQCVDIDGYSSDDNAKVQTWDCHPEDKDPAHQNQAFSVTADGTIVEDSTGKCLTRGQGCLSDPVVLLYHCTGGTNQKWDVRDDGTIRARDTGDCMDASPAVPSAARPCDQQPGKSMAFCNYALPVEQRIANLVQNLTVDEKVYLFATTHARCVQRLNIPDYEWWSEALHGVGFSPGVHFGGETPCVTSFPQVINSGATFNSSLWTAIGATISTEARALNNVNRAGLTYWAPNVNIFRDPRWGRGQETPGEDPYHTALYAEKFVSAMQNGEDSKHLKVSSCCKHYTAYDLEDWNGVDRHHFNAIVTAQDMSDTFMPPFQSCVERARASSLMCSYNSVNGVPSCANYDILTKTARNQWGFKGYITSDCGAVDDVLYTHKYVSTPEETCKVTLEAGMDIDCGGGFTTSHLRSALDKGIVKIATVDEHLTNLFAVQFRLGIFDPVDVQPYLKISYKDSVANPAQRQLALEASRQSIVLLKNNGILPLKAQNIKSIAVVGPSSDATGTMQGNYQGNACFLISPAEGISKYVPQTQQAHGCAIDSQDTSGFAAAKALVQSADATVIVVGINQDIESEGKDRYSIDLPGVQNQFIQEMASAAKGPVVVVYMIGGQVDMTVAKDNPKVGGILWVGYPGQSGGQAIADVLFGTFNPGGRLPYTIYQSNYVQSVSLFDMGMRPNATTKNPGRTYRFFNGSVVYPFGSGLSYTTFSVSTTLSSEVVELSRVAAYARDSSTYLAPEDAQPETTASVTIKNTGSVAGDYVLLVFTIPPTPGKGGQPLKSLSFFQRVYLRPGESVTVPYSVTAHDLTLVGQTGQRQAEAGVWHLSVGVPEALRIPIRVA